MTFLKNKTFLFALIFLFIGVNILFLSKDNFLLSTLPVVLILVYIAFFHLRLAFLLVVFLTPLSINIGEMLDLDIGIFLPTEPLLIILLFISIFREIQNPEYSKGIWKQPLTQALLFYLFWLLITSITSTQPLVSFKFLIMKMWYIVPIFLIGYTLFSQKKNIALMMWCYSISLSIVIIYTLIRHSLYSFNEPEGHWVMYPFYKDHTIYGAGIALGLFFVIGLFIHKVHTIQTYVVLSLLLVITCVGLYFSYSRAAWLSVLFGVGVWLIIYLRIKFKYLLLVTLTLGGLVLLFQHEIEMVLSKNKDEHTTTNFEEKFRSSINYTTDLSNLERINRYEATFNMALDKPIFGFGPGTYAFEYAPYQNPNSLTLISTNFGYNGNAHSEYFGPMAETGFIGLLSVLLFVIALFYTGITTMVKIKNYLPEEKSTYFLLLGLVLACSTYFLHGLINNFLDSDKAAVPIYTIAIIFIAQKVRIDKLIQRKKIIT